jgi:uncharacterized membrane protein YkoI
MKARIVLTLALMLVVARRLSAQRTQAVSDGDVSRARADRARLAAVIPGVDPQWRPRVRVEGDSAQRLAMAHFDWRGRVSSVEIDEEGSRLYWDVKIVPDSTRETIVRYRVDAASGGILSIKEFTGIRGLARRRP